MVDTPTAQVFPHDTALCEACGYPLKGLSHDAVCPECGLHVQQSSPALRDLDLGVKAMTFGVYARLAWRLLLKPRRAFRALPVHRTNRVPEQVLIQSSLIAGLLVSTILFVGATFVVVPRYHRIPIQSALLVFVVTTLLVNLLTWIEMMGVTAFSRRRGWRVPFPLAMRVCCLASVGWLPGAVLAGAGIWMIQAYGVGRPWFDSLFGLVRVGWLCYAGLFVLAFLWFETLVWIGVRQVRFANAWAEIQR